MNGRQWAVLSLEAAVLLAMLAVPPHFGVDRESAGRVHAHLGYFALWNPPTPAEVCRALRERYPSLAECENRLGAFDAGVNRVRLLLNASSTVVLSAALLYLLRDRSKTPASPDGASNVGP